MFPTQGSNASPTLEGGFFTTAPPHPALYKELIVSLKIGNILLLTNQELVCSQLAKWREESGEFLFKKGPRHLKDSWTVEIKDS